VALASTVIATACTASGSPGRANVRDGPGSSQRAGTNSLLPRTPFALPSFDFEAYQQLGRQLRGTPIVVNIWSSWCGPCRSEAPYLGVAANAYRNQVQFLGVDILDQRGAAKSFMERYDWTFPSVFDERGEIRDRLGFIGQPETLFYNAAGQLVQTWIGSVTAKVLDDGIHRVLSLP
jgi:thiol-disulfide isomerase/thioredoxin